MEGVAVDCGLEFAGIFQVACSSGLLNQVHADLVGTVADAAGQRRGEARTTILHEMSRHPSVNYDCSAIAQ
jgi:hypothetical protein